jgi:cytochrome c556
MKRWLVAAAAVLGVSGIAWAQGGTVSFTPDQVIAARQAGYDLMYGDVGGMKAAAENNLNVKDSKDAADAVVSWSRVIPTLFPDGTQQGHDTKAKPNIWSDRAGFEKDAANLTDQATRLAQLADAGDKAGFAKQLKATAGACKTCHDTYKAR